MGFGGWLFARRALSFWGFEAGFLLVGSLSLLGFGSWFFALGGSPKLLDVF